MKALLILAAILLTAACATKGAPQVNCTGRLEPINAPAPPANTAPTAIAAPAAKADPAPQ